MGLLGKILLIAALILLGMWAYNNLKIGTVNVCITPVTTTLNITCVDASDCNKYLTSQYGTYPNTPESAFVLSQTTTCNQGVCNQKIFNYEKTCQQGDIPLTYKVTIKDWLSKKNFLTL